MPISLDRSAFKVWRKPPGNAGIKNEAGNRDQAMMVAEIPQTMVDAINDLQTIGMRVPEMSMLARKTVVIATQVEIMKMLRSVPETRGKTEINSLAKGKTRDQITGTDRKISGHNYRHKMAIIRGRRGHRGKVETTVGHYRHQQPEKMILKKLNYILINTPRFGNKKVDTGCRRYLLRPCHRCSSV